MSEYTIRYAARRGVGDIDLYWSLQAKLKDNDTVYGAMKDLLERQTNITDQEPPHGAQTALAILDREYDETMQGIKSLPIQLRPTDYSARKAEEVFGIPELFEKILLELNSWNLLKDVQLMCRAADAMLRTSTILQRHMMLKPVPDAFFTPPELWVHSPLSSVCVCHDWEYSHMRSYAPPPSKDASFVSITVRSGIDTQRFGSRVRSMLICQPPLSEVRASMACCNGDPDDRFTDDSRDPSFESVTLSRNSGLTIGDIVDLAAELQAKHLHCPYASEYLHRGDGTVMAEAHFRGPIVLRPDDPLIERGRSPRYGLGDVSPSYSHEAVERHKYRLEQTKKTHAFMAAKRHGTCSSRVFWVRVHD